MAGVAVPVLTISFITISCVMTRRKHAYECSGKTGADLEALTTVTEERRVAAIVTVHMSIQTRVKANYDPTSTASHLT